VKTVRIHNSGDTEVFKYGEKDGAASGRAKSCPERMFSFVVYLTERKSHITGKAKMSTSDKKQAASIVWFEIPADDLQRARVFYGSLRLRPAG
jgi:NRPS condensation-like uncharacterized protein